MHNYSNRNTILALAIVEFTVTTSLPQIMVGCFIVLILAHWGWQRFSFWRQNHEIVKTTKEGVDKSFLADTPLDPVWDKMLNEATRRAYPKRKLAKKGRVKQIARVK